METLFAKHSPFVWQLFGKKNKEEAVDSGSNLSCQKIEKVFCFSIIEFSHKGFDSVPFLDGK
jgi:hypothetical protein